MIDPSSGLRFQSPLARQAKRVPAASPEQCEDQVHLGQRPALEIMPSAPFAPATGLRGTIHRLLKTSMQASFLLGTVAVCSLAPSMVQAQQMAPPTAEEQIKMLQSYGLSSDTSQAILKNPELVKNLQTLPKDVVARYQSLNSNQKRVLGQELEGKTRVGLIVVHHRDAFVNGKALGMDAFPRMIEKLEGRVQKGHLTPAEGVPLISAVEQMRSLTPAQRDSVATVLALETHTGQK